MYVVGTSQQPLYGAAWLTTRDQYFQFTVQACWDAKIILFSGYGTGNGLRAYEIILGAEGNTKVRN